MNRHEPHSAISNPPRTHKDCAACGGSVQLQHNRTEHQCSEVCHPHGVTHDYAHEKFAPLVRYFRGGEEVCVGCVAKQALREHHETNGGIKAGDVISLGHIAIEVTGFDERGQMQLKVRQ